METLANLEAFVRSAESGSFSEAARRLSLTPAASAATWRCWSGTSGAAVSPLDAQAHLDRGRRGLPPGGRRKPGWPASRDCRRLSGRRRAGRNAQGQPAADLWVKPRPAASAGLSGPPSARPSGMALREPPGRPRRRGVRCRHRRRLRAVPRHRGPYSGTRPTSSLWRRRPTCGAACRPPIRLGSKDSTASSCGRSRPVASGTGRCETQPAARRARSCGKASS